VADSILTAVRRALSPFCWKCSLIPFTAKITFGSSRDASMGIWPPGFGTLVFGAGMAFSARNSVLSLQLTSWRISLSDDFNHGRLHTATLQTSGCEPPLISILYLCIDPATTCDVADSILTAVRRELSPFCWKCSLIPFTAKITLGSSRDASTGISPPGIGTLVFGVGMDFGSHCGSPCITFCLFAPSHGRLQTARVHNSFCSPPVTSSLYL